MSALQSTARMTATEYLAWEATQPGRHDFYDGEVYAMAGGSDAHNTVSGDVFITLKQHLKGTPCRTFINDMRLALADDSHYCYPDVFVTCDPRDQTPEAALTKRFPALVIEVLSPSTAAYDRGLKFQHFRAHASLAEVLFIDPDSRSVELYRRNAAGRWELFSPDEHGELLLQSIELTLSAGAIFNGLSAG